MDKLLNSIQEDEVHPAPSQELAESQGSLAAANPACEASHWWEEWYSLPGARSWGFTGVLGQDAQSPSASEQVTAWPHPVAHEKASLPQTAQGS